MLLYALNYTTVYIVINFCLHVLNLLFNNSYTEAVMAFVDMLLMTKSKQIQSCKIDIMSRLNISIIVGFS